MIYDKQILEGSKNDEGLNRRIKMIYVLQKMLDKYKVDDTVLIITFVDGYFWKEDIPVFNIALPIGFQGLIFTNFDIFIFNE